MQQNNNHDEELDNEYVNKQSGLSHAYNNNKLKEYNTIRLDKIISFNI
jgi:hypothetical protein